MGLRDDTLRVLDNPNLRNIDFRLFGKHIRGQDYARIAECIRNGHVQIVEAGYDDGVKARYVRSLNAFIYNASPNPNLIVHEATHALCDWHAHRLSGLADEGIAYVAQMIFFLGANPNIQRGVHRNQFQQAIRHNQFQCGASGGLPCNHVTMQMAMLVATAIREGEEVTSEMVEAYRSTLSVDPRILQPEQTRTYNRIERVEISQEYLDGIQGRIVMN